MSYAYRDSGYAADRAGGAFKRAGRVKESTGHRVAVIGSGPAGLTAAFYLVKKGHHVTVFEAGARAGGMMRYIPHHRLPPEVLDREIAFVLSTGIELLTEKKLGRDFDLQELKESGFEAIFIATGLPKVKKIDLEGADSEGVFWGIEFLAEVDPRHISSGNLYWWGKDRRGQFYYRRFYRLLGAL